MKVLVNCNDKRWKKYAIDFQKIANAAAPHRRKAEVSITLTNDTEIHKLNYKYRGIDKPTNVLSFELGDDLLLGDIFISLDTIKREADAAGISVAEHTAHMIVHGVLHLQGYDHLTDADAAIMEGKEIEILEKMGIKNPYDDAPVAHGALPDKKSLCARFGRVQHFCKFVLMGAFGAIAAFGFAPFYYWWATVIGIAGMYWLTVRDGKKRKFWRAWLSVFPFGACYAIAMFWWTLHSIYVVPELAQQFAIWTIPALICIGLFGAIVFNLPFVLIHCIRTIPARRAILFAFSWAGVLWMREWVLTGFPWNPIANITMPYPVIANSMSVWGALGLTFIIIGLIASIVEIIMAPRCRRCWLNVFLFFLLFGIGCMAGHNNILKTNETETAKSITVRIVQPAKSQAEKMVVHSRADAVARANAIVQDLIELANVGDVKTDLIIFPETSYPFVIADTEFPMSRELQTNVIIGATAFFDGSKFFNSMVLANEDGIVENLYRKSHLVPFGEYSPLSFLPSPSHLDAGDGADVLSMNLNGTDFSFAPAICYEIIFSDSLIPRGRAIDAIINITNDTWFGKTSGTYQHLDMVRRYAIESGAPIIRANYSGISAFVSADGEIISSLPIGVRGYLDGTVASAHKTIYRAIGRDGTFTLILLISMLWIFAIGKKQK